MGGGLLVNIHYGGLLTRCVYVYNQCQAVVIYRQDSGIGHSETVDCSRCVSDQVTYLVTTIKPSHKLLIQAGHCRV